MKTLAQIAFILFMGTSFHSNAQCRGYSKRKCRPELGEYTHDGKMNFAQLFAGDKAEIQLTFYKGQSYRLLVCSDDTFKGVEFNVYDGANSKVFDSEKNDKDMFDFKVGATQQLTVEIKVPQDGNETHNEFETTGCVSVMVGIK